MEWVLFKNMILNRKKSLLNFLPKEPFSNRVMKKMEEYSKENGGTKIFEDIDLDLLLEFSRFDGRFKSGRTINNIFYETSVELEILFPGEPVKTEHLVKRFEKFILKMVGLIKTAYF